jgi:TatD DNase family protein
LGIGGVLTFKNSGLDKVMEQISLDHIVLETDSPYLTPVPFRGKRNQSSYINHIAEKLAVIKNVSKEEVAEITSQNAIQLFNLPH